VGVNIELHIEELLLDGFAPKDRYAIGEGLQTELVRLLTEQGMPGHLPVGVDVEAARLDAGSFAAGPEDGAEGLGAQIARSVYQGLGR
jgi:hypothetical protein